MGKPSAETALGAVSLLPLYSSTVLGVLGNEKYEKLLLCPQNLTCTQNWCFKFHTQRLQISSVVLCLLLVYGALRSSALQR